MNVKRSEGNSMTALAIKKSLLKEYSTQSCDRTVYMDGGSEFQIQIFNPYNYRIGAKISINGEELEDTLVVRPGERIWLDRYLSEARKFKFDTYEVDGDSAAVKDAIRFNGRVEVRYYQEKARPRQLSISTYPYQPYQQVYFNSATPKSVPEPQIMCLNTCEDRSTSFSATEVSAYCSSITDHVESLAASSASICDTAANALRTRPRLKSASIETGRVEKGGYSDQRLETVDADFESWSFKTDILMILPTSRKPVTSSDLVKRFCPSCGKKVSPKFKFCPSCGEEL